MKKSIVTILVLAAVTLPVTAQAKTIGTVLSTDIGTVIDGAACKTYNVDGRTFVVAEDLQGYGFDIDYNDSARRLTVTQNPYSQRTLLTADEVNIEKKNCPVGNRVMDILSSDITVTVEGETVEGYNIDGRMVIPVRALESCAYVEYDNDKRLVTIRGLKHCLDERHSAGNPNVTREVKEYSRRTLNSHYTLGWPGEMIDHESNGTVEYVDVREETTTDNENGSIYAYFGNPLSRFVPSNLYYFENCPDREIYKIESNDGKILYDADLMPRQENDMDSLHIITDDYAQIINADKKDYLYNYTIYDERGHNNYWPSEEEINATDIRFEKLVRGGAISKNGFYYEINHFDDEERHLKRYNMKSENVSRDNVLFELQTGYNAYFNDEKRNSMFDRLVAYNVKKNIDENCILNTSGEFVYKGNVLMRNLSDMMSIDGGRKLCVLTNDGEVYTGDYGDFWTNKQTKIADGMKSIWQLKNNDSTIYYINSGDELYTYYTPNKQGAKVADNISKVIISGDQPVISGRERWFITTDGILTDLEQDYAEDVKDARFVTEERRYEYEGPDGKTYYGTKYDRVTYIIKTDGTLWYYKDGELARVKTFE